jgi:RpiR family transcriptional regulator, carbohydrate utilization regulator
MIESWAGPEVGGTVDHIRERLPELVPSERRVAVEILRAPDEVALSSVGDLAARAGTSPATVTRACQNLGLRGFQHLRRLLLRDVGADDAARPVPEEDAHWVRAMFDDGARDLRVAGARIDLARFEAAAAVIAAAPRVLVAASGGSAPSAQLFALRLVTGGRPCEAPPDALTQQLTARTLGPDDVCVAVSDDGLNRVTLRVVEAAQRAGAKVVGVTSYARSRLAELATHPVIAGVGSQPWNRSVGNVVQFLTLTALQTAVAGVAGTEIMLPELFEQALVNVEDEPGDV